MSPAISCLVREMSSGHVNVSKLPPLLLVGRYRQMYSGEHQATRIVSLSFYLYLQTLYTISNIPFYANLPSTSSYRALPPITPYNLRRVILSDACQRAECCLGPSPHPRYFPIICRKNPLSTVSLLLESRENRRYAGRLV